MPINLNEAIQKIIEVQDGGNWSSIVVGIKKSMAEDIVSQATNRVILG